VRILFLSAWFPSPADNGSKIRVHNLVRALAQHHDISLCSFVFGSARPESPGDLGSLCPDTRVVACNPFAVNKASPLRTFVSPRPMATRAIAAMSRQVNEVLLAGTFDAIVSSTGVMADYALQAPAGPARILEEHNSMTRWMHERYAQQKLLATRLRCWVSWQKSRRYEAHLFRQFHVVTMVSEQDRAACLADLPGYRGPVSVVPNGVDCQHNRPGLGLPRPHSLVFNGSLTYDANYDAMRYFLSDIFPLVQAQVPGVSLTITGPTEGVDLRSLQLASVRLTGYLDDVRPEVAGAWVCVVPIRMGGGTRLKILEAMALGTPVVATSKAAEGLDVSPESHLLIADSPAEFAGHVVRLLGDPAERARLAASARQLVEQRYEWRRIGRDFAAIVEAAIGDLQR